MKKIPDILRPIFTYGSFTVPFVNYLLENDFPENWKVFAQVIKHIWRGEYEPALQMIEKALKVCRSKTARDILMAKKLGISRNLGKPDLKLYRYLKKRLPSMSKIARNVALPVLINAEAFGISSSRSVRIWGKEYEVDDPTSAFLHLARARKLAEQSKISEAIFHYVRSYKHSKKVPHPSGMVSALNGIAWRIRKTHPIWAYSISQKAVFWLGYYREEAGNLFDAFDTLFTIEKYLGLVSTAFTAEIISSLTVPEIHSEFLDEVRMWKPCYNVSEYPNTEELRTFIKGMVGTYRKERVSAGRLSEIINGKTQSVRGNTLKKLIKPSTVNVKAPFPVYNELVKLEIEMRFEEAIKSIKEMPPLKRKKLFISTYMAQIGKKEFYISRKDKFREACRLLEYPEEFKEFMSKRYETMRFVAEMIRAHPYIEGRKATLSKALDKMNGRRLSEFIERYGELGKEEKVLINTFLRNHGRYDGVKFEIRLKGPDEVREFAKKYSLKIQPSFVAFWCEENAKIRRKLTSIMRYMIQE
ncbi:hypothetical protein Ferpe_1068 [Fervidobacterium pennivorans DSM 9078]|uniref:Uncharacterized protein n=1 Tax=Fervidobacterium pennivorans (strain DSM 9078 / Ven5) TaxID=771875 RepID=H9UCD1_FERPD|nr:hypothetical protein [Fervidobacterium pennivorans]AFG35174.1 hypothetical protein Ferpe_1068 [Fervidobacterium pennivorans DSM 9078]